MELVVKLYNDRPSRIGIKYIYEYLAVREYETLFKNDPTLDYSMKLELIRDKLNLYLQSDVTGLKHLFKSLDFKLEHLNRLQANYKPAMELQYVHVFPKNNTLMVAKPFRKQMFIKVSHLEFINPVLAGYH